MAPSPVSEIIGDVAVMCTLALCFEETAFVDVFTASGAVIFDSSAMPCVEAAPEFDTAPESDAAPEVVAVPVCAVPAAPDDEHAVAAAVTAAATVSTGKICL